MFSSLSKAISESLNIPFSIHSSEPVSGGDINQSSILRNDDGRRWFIKTNHSSALPMFEAEAKALTEIQTTHAIKVPQSICTGAVTNQSFILLELLDLGGRIDMPLFGTQMAKLHLAPTGQKKFGWTINNTIGLTPQVNNWTDNWPEFYATHRLHHQLDLAVINGCSTALMDKGLLLTESLDQFFSNYQPQVSLLHGDLWSGNWGADQSGRPVIFDPASYYGDHEADLAMMELFGNPGKAFFSAYQSVFPIDPGYSTRKNLYNLYHILNHYNLFAGGYAQQAESMLDQLLAELR